MRCGCRVNGVQGGGSSLDVNQSSLGRFTPLVSSVKVLPDLHNLIAERLGGVDCVGCVFIHGKRSGSRRGGGCSRRPVQGCSEVRNGWWQVFWGQFLSVVLQLEFVCLFFVVSCNLLAYISYIVQYVSRGPRGSWDGKGLPGSSECVCLNIQIS